MASKNVRTSKDLSSQRLILDILKRKGPTDSVALAKTIGVTPMGVRQHLYELQSQGLVIYHEEKRPKGRPAKLWKLTDNASDFFPNGHAELTASLLTTLRETLGQGTLDKVIKARGAEQLNRYLSEMEILSTVKERVQKLAKLRTAEGYMAEIKERSDGSFLLIENHCPICVAAKTCQLFCSVELQIFQKALGSGVSVKRSEHLLSENGARCVYEIASTEN